MKNWSISSDTNRRDIDNVLVYGYCRSNMRDIHELYPCQLLDLCYQFYFIMYIANDQSDIDRKFGSKFYLISNIKEQLIWNNIIENK